MSQKDKSSAAPEQDACGCAPPKASADKELDLLIIGAGSAGFAAAIRAEELGAHVALVEAGALGGTCVNVGCVPSKTLIRAAEVLHKARHHGFAGVRVESQKPNFAAIIEQKRALVAELQQAKYSDVLAAHPSIRLIEGRARFRADGSVEVNGEPLPARKILISTGASAWLPPIPGLDETPALTSTELMELQSLPARLIVVGGGYVGLELGQTFARLGAKVTVLARSRLLSSEDPEISEALAMYLREEGLEVLTEVDIQRVSGEPGRFGVDFVQGDRAHSVEAEQLFVATGRRSNTTGMGLAEAGVELGESGQVLVNEHLATSLPHVYAAGDVTGDPAFVYVAAYAGNMAAGNALQGDKSRYDLSVVPRVTFTDPALASVGLTEAQARERGDEVIVSVLPMSAVPRAIAARDTRGLVKLVAGKKTRLLLGAHMIAPEAGEMVQAVAMMIRFDITIDDVAAMLHPYLTNAEALKLACQTFDKDVATLSCCAA